MEKIYDEKRCALASKHADLSDFPMDGLWMANPDARADLSGFLTEAMDWADTQIELVIATMKDEDPPLWVEHLAWRTDERDKRATLDDVHYLKVDRYWDEDEEGD